MKKTTTIILIFVSMFVGCLVGTFATLKAYKQHDIAIGSAGPNSYKLNAIWNLVNSRYVDPIEGDTLVERIYASILSTLDPHSNYLSGAALAKETEALQGHFEGIGIVIKMLHDTVCVGQVIADGPSERAGLLAGDRILKVDGRKVAGVSMSTDTVISLLRGPRKSTANIEILRLSEGKTRNVKIVRDVISTPSVTYSGMIDTKTGYTRLSRFGATTYEEFCQSLKALKDKGMQHLVLDLRANGGGMLSAAIDICDELLPGRELIVYTKGAHQKRENAYSKPGGLFCQGKVTVIIDEFSASASEIVAGAIQDNDRGTIVGRRSFGKGLVQQQFSLPDNSAVLLTIARYYTPSGRCIQRPYDKGTDEYYADFLKHVAEEYNSDSILYQINDSTPYHTTKGRLVYGGGGIMPDHIIHIKSDPKVIYYNKLINKSIINDFAFNIVSLKGSEIKKMYPNEEIFVKNFNISDSQMEALFLAADKAGITRDKTSIDSYRQEIKTRLKAEIGDMLYTNNAFYKLLLPYDPELKETLEVSK